MGVQSRVENCGCPAGQAAEIHEYAKQRIEITRFYQSIKAALSFTYNRKRVFFNEGAVVSLCSLLT
jgi:IS4 transposase